MPPQMESHAACDAMPSTRARRALDDMKPDAVSAQSASKQDHTVASLSSPPLQQGVTRDSRLLIPEGCLINGDGGCRDGGAQATSCCVRERVGAMQDKFGEQLQFLVTEFTKIETQLAPSFGHNEKVSDGQEDASQHQLARLRYFILHVRHTIDRMDEAKCGVHNYTDLQVNMLEEHIEQRLLPVRDRMLAQLTQRRASNDSASGTPEDNATLTACDDSMAVSDGWMCSATSSTDRSAANSLRGESIPSASSASSFAGLGDLRGDQGGDVDCGDAFLVGGDCGDVDGSGIGLDLYDLGQGKDSFLLPPREHSSGRSASMSTMSCVSAITDGELSDDNLSVEPEGGRADGDGGAAERVATSGIDQEMGELTKLFAPDAFLTSAVLETEEREALGIVASKSSAKDVKAVSGGSEETSNNAPTIVPTAPALSVPSSPSSRASLQQAVERASPDATPVSVVQVPEPEQAAPAVASVPPKLEVGQQLVHHPQHSASVGTITRTANPGASLSQTPIPAPIARRQECDCGDASCPSVIAAARKRRLQTPPAEGAAPATPVSLVTGLPYAQQSSRQRKRQRSLAPVLAAPRTVKYECSVCKEGYESEICSNPWWSLFRHECPKCHRMQIPRVDASSAAVSVDHIHAVCAEDGEGCDSDGYGSDSGSESDDDKDDDRAEGIAAFDTDVIAGDESTGCPERRLSTFQASRLLVLMAHARTCPGRHSKPQHAEVCRSTKFLMLHIRDCTGHGPNGERCEHRWCQPCKSLLSHLVRCPVPSTCRICTPLDLPGPLRSLRELNVAQASAAAVRATAAPLPPSPP